MQNALLKPAKYGEQLSFFKNRDGQTPLPEELKKGLKIRNLQTIGELDEFEEQNIAEGVVWLQKQNKDWKDYLFWKELHRHLFETVWKWAGAWRIHELQNPDFSRPCEIQAAIKHLEGDLHHWIDDQSLTPEEKIARFHERFVSIHPFANGNGRTGRILSDYFAESLGIDMPKWGFQLKLDPDERRQAYLDSLRKASRDGKHQDLVKFMFTQTKTSLAATPGLFFGTKRENKK